MADYSSLVRSISVAPEEFDAPDSLALRDELGTDLMERYAADAEPGVKPTAWDVAVFLVARDGHGRAVGCGALRELGAAAGEIEGFGVYAGHAASRCFERALEP